MAKYRIAVVGPGYIGLEHMKAIVDNTRSELRTVGGKNRKKLQKMRYEQFACEQITTNYEAILEDNKVDIVYLCTPNRLHADEAVAALEAGKHVFCEKPMATTLEGCRQMVEAVDKSGRHLMVGHGARFRPINRTVKELYETGKLGEACFCESDYIHSLQPFLEGPGHQWWRHLDEGQFAVIGGGCHPLDLMRWIVGEFEEVYAYGMTKVLHDVDWDDTVIATLKFKSGAVGKCLVSVGAPRPYAMNFSLYGTEGTVENNKFFLKAFGEVEKFTEMPFPILGETHSCAEELEHFLNCLDADKPPMIDVRDGARTVAACLAIVESLKTDMPAKVVTEF
jgi:predicted dehydrogenase